MEKNKNPSCTGKDIKETPFHNDKGLSHQEDMTILIVYSQNKKQS